MCLIINDSDKICKHNIKLNKAKIPLILQLAKIIFYNLFLSRQIQILPANIRRINKLNAIFSGFNYIDLLLFSYLHLFNLFANFFHYPFTFANLRSIIKVFGNIKKVNINFECFFILWIYLTKISKGINYIRK